MEASSLVRWLIGRTWRYVVYGNKVIHGGEIYLKVRHLERY